MNIIQILKGGKGSGNFRHSGRPGKRGGSGGGGGMPKKPTSDEIDDVAKLLKNNSNVRFREIVGGQMEHDPDLNKISTRGKWQNPKGVIFQEMNDGECHWNVSKLYKKGKIDSIVIGYTQEPRGFWYQHTWGLKDNKIVETTLSNEFNASYFGMTLTSTESGIFVKHAAKNPPRVGKVRFVE